MPATSCSTSRSVADVPPHKRNIGMVFQSYSLFPHMTVADNVGFPLRMRTKLSREAARKRIAEMLELVQLAHLASRYPRQLSGGQQQRVAMARALVSHPRLLLMDEPLGALDKKLREQMQIEIKRIHRSVGTTVIYVTHDQTEALTMSDLVVVMHQARIAQVGTPRVLYEAPANLFVADFLGDSNLLPAEDRRARPATRSLVEIGNGDDAARDARRRSQPRPGRPGRRADPARRTCRSRSSGRAGRTQRRSPASSRTSAITATRSSSRSRSATTCSRSRSRATRAPAWSRGRRSLPDAGERGRVRILPVADAERRPGATE